MIKDIINQIKESEEKAKEIITSSKKEASEIIEKAYKKVNKQINDADIKAKKIFDKAEAMALEDAEAEKSRLEARYEKKIKAIRSISRRKEDIVIQKLVDIVLK